MKKNYYSVDLGADHTHITSIMNCYSLKDGNKEHAYPFICINDHIPASILINSTDLCKTFGEEWCSLEQ